MRTIKPFDARSLAAGSLRGNVLGMNGLGDMIDQAILLYDQVTGQPSNPSVSWSDSAPAIASTGGGLTPIATPSTPAAKPSGGGGGSVSTAPAAPPQEAGMDWTPILIGAGILAVVGGGMWLYSGKR